jgi:ketosteroid isomerase-like protein
MEDIADEDLPNYGIRNRASYMHYVKLFNEKNPQAFEAYFAPDILYINGGLVLEGIPEVQDHYHKIWSVMQEDLTVEEFVFDGDTLAVQLHAKFTVMETKKESPFGAVKKGDGFDYFGSIIYKINHLGKIQKLTVSYLDFKVTKDGVTKSVGMPH